MSYMTNHNNPLFHVKMPIPIPKKLHVGLILSYNSHQNSREWGGRTYIIRNRENRKRAKNGERAWEISVCTACPKIDARGDQTGKIV